MEKTKKYPIKDQEINHLFEKFSYPMTKAAITKSQKETSTGIAKILWLFLITGNDSEENIYNILNQVLDNRHEDNLALGSLYFFKMKKALTQEELLRLKKYYSIQKNFDALKDWGLSSFIEKIH